jgi:RNA polymerase sigma factor (sigma-70 family)
VTEAATPSPARISRGLPFSGRRRERAAGEHIAALFEEHGRMVYGVCRLLLRDAVEAEDAAQQTFLSAYRALLGGQEPRDPSAWLGTIARNECRSRLRARQTEPLALVTEPVGEELQREVSRRQEVEALSAALAELPPQQRDAILLREFYGLSYAEVAAALGISGAAVESLLFRSRKRLQEQLRPMRSALGALTLPISLRESLGQALPGFGGSAASAGAGTAVLAKLASAPVVAKLAAVTLAVGTVGTVAGVERGRHGRKPPVVAPAVQHAVVRRAAPKHAPATEATRRPTIAFVAAKPSAPAPARTVSTPRPSVSGESEHESSSEQEGGSIAREPGDDETGGGDATTSRPREHDDEDRAAGTDDRHESSGGEQESDDSTESGDSGDSGD